MQQSSFENSNGTIPEVHHRPNLDPVECDAPNAEGTALDCKSRGTSDGPDAEAPIQTDKSSVLQPIPELRPKRRVDLTLVALPGAGDITAVESLEIRELKGIWSPFTPYFEGMLTFHTIVYKPKGAFETVYQILGKKLHSDPRIIQRARRVTFLPVYSWATAETVIMPIKMSTYGARVLGALKKLQPQCPNVKAYVEWSQATKRHVVSRDDLSNQEQEVIKCLRWPTSEEMLDALSDSAFDNIEDLAAVNDDVNAFLRAREVD